MNNQKTICDIHGENPCYCPPVHKRLGAEGSACIDLIGCSGAEDEQGAESRAKPGELRTIGHDDPPACVRCLKPFDDMKGVLCADCFVENPEMSTEEVRRAERESFQSEADWKRKRCPDCGNALLDEGDIYFCQHCGSTAGKGTSGAERTTKE